MNVVIAGGGTAGHVNPAIALASALGNAEVTFVGTAQGAESKLVPRAGFRLELIEVRGFDRARPASLARIAPIAAGAVFASRRLLKRAAPDVVVGMGGYVALPVCLAAAMRRTPVVLHEQNIVFGLTNRLCKPFAKRVCVSFTETLPSAGRRGVDVGNPVLPELAAMDAALERKKGMERYSLEPNRKTLLVFGGSQGARRINELVPGLLQLWAHAGDRQVLHISGPRDARTIRVVDPKGALIYRGVPYVERMGEAYAVADLAVCRGGATTVAELGAVGLPAVVVPYTHHRDRQQELHARALERSGAAHVVADADATAERVASIIDPLFTDERALESMRANARSFGRPEAAQKLASIVTEVAA